MQRHPFLSRLALFVLLPGVLLLLGGYVVLERSVPQRSGQLALPGLKAPVEVDFDENGVPRIVAATDRDAFFMQGYLHASERMWQMELQRRVVRGRLSEVFGASTVSSDTWMRVLGLHRSAKDAWRSLSPDAKDALRAYADGVNAWMRTTAELPPEFLFFGVRPEEWTPTDSLGWQKMLALDLGQNMHAELERVAALKLMSPEKLRTFYPYDPDLQHYARSSVAPAGAQPDVAHATGGASHQAQTAAPTSRFAGSNAWVVSGRHTRSGSPMIANDPHLAVRQPSIWYAAQLRGDRISVDGMSLVGIPGVLLGRNDHIAWAATSLMSDQQDLFELDVPVENNHVFRTSEGLLPIATSEEVLTVASNFPAFLNKDIEPVAVRIRRTSLGPVVSDGLASADRVYALRWSALDADDRSFEAFLQLQYARDWREFRAALALLKAPGLNFLYADRSGNIGSQAAGALPVRGFGDGVLPLPALEGANRWRGYVPFEQLPSEFNPESGMIASANAEIRAASDIVISHEWAPPLREQRITALLRARTEDDAKLDAESMASIQTDVLDAGAAQLLGYLRQQGMERVMIAGAPQDVADVVERASAVLFEWNAEYRLDSAGATIYHYWLIETKKRIFGELNPEGWSLDRNPLARSLIGFAQEASVLAIVQGNDDQWCVRQLTHRINCQQEVVEGLHAAVQEIRKQTKSDDPDDWTWGKLHRVEYVHQPLGQVKALTAILNSERPAAGAQNTLNVADANQSEQGGLVQTFGVSFRQVFDLARTGGYYVVPMGQSGHFLDTHYSDMAAAFDAGRLHRFHTSDDPEQMKLRVVPAEREGNEWRR